MHICRCMYIHSIYIYIFIYIYIYADASLSLSLSLPLSLSCPLSLSLLSPYTQMQAHTHSHAQSYNDICIHVHVGDFPSMLGTPDSNKTDTPHPNHQHFRLGNSCHTNLSFWIIWWFNGYLLGTNTNGDGMGYFWNGPSANHLHHIWSAAAYWTFAPILRPTLVREKHIPI